MPATDVARRLTVGAELQPRGGAHVRVWAPACRRIDLAIRRAGSYRPEGAVLGPGAFLLRYIDAERGDRLLLVNLSRDLDFVPAREPLLAAPVGSRWRLGWSSESSSYGGSGTPPIDTDAEWRMPGGCALFFVPEARTV